MTSYKLSEIANIVTGYTFRSALVPDVNGNYQVIQAKDIGAGFVFEDENLTKIMADKLPENTIVRSGDVVLSSRGRYRAAVVKVEVPTIASSSVFVLRVNKNLVSPEYLSIFLNSPSGQSQLERLSSGNYIKSIPKYNLEGLVIETPSEDEQLKVSRLYKSIVKQQELLSKKISILSTISESSLLHVLNSNN